MFPSFVHPTAEKSMLGCPLALPTAVVTEARLVRRVSLSRPLVVLFWDYQTSLGIERL